MNHERTYTKKEIRTLWIAAALCAAVTALGILLSVTQWNSGLGIFGLILLTFFGGLTLAFAIIAVSVKPKHPTAPSKPALAALTEQEWTVIKRRVIILTAVLAVLFVLVALLAENKNWLILFVPFIAATVGALMIALRENHLAKGTPIILSFAVGILAALFSGDLSNQEYDWVINGIRQTDAIENFSGKVSLLLMTAVGCFVLMYFGGKFLLWLCIPKKVR